MSALVNVGPFLFLDIGWYSNDEHQALQLDGASPRLL